MTWRSREPRGPRKRAERLADRRSRRDRGKRVRVCYSACFPSQGQGMEFQAVHPPHTYIWKTVPCTGLLGGFWDKVLGASSTSNSQPPGSLAQFAVILFFFLKWSWRLNLGVTLPPSMVLRTQAFCYQANLPPPSILQSLDLSADGLPGSYLYLAKYPREDSPTNRNHISKPGKELGEPGRRWLSVNICKTGPTGKLDRSRQREHHAQSRLGTARRNSSLSVVGECHTPSQTCPASWPQRWGDQGPQGL